MTNDVRTTPLAELWIQYARLSEGGFGRVMLESDFMEMMKRLQSEIASASMEDENRCMGVAAENCELARRASGKPSAVLYSLPRGWSFKRQDDGIVVSHKDEGAVFVREAGPSIAETLLFYLADDFLNPALTTIGSRSATLFIMPIGWSAKLVSTDPMVYEIQTPFGVRVAQQEFSMPHILFELVHAAVTSKAVTIEQMVDRFLSWPLPKDFSPDCGISFDGRKPDQWNPNKGWPIGTNLLTATQARAMLEHILGKS